MTSDTRIDWRETPGGVKLAIIERRNVDKRFSFQAIHEAGASVVLLHAFKIGAVARRSYLLKVQYSRRPLLVDMLERLRRVDRDWGYGESPNTIVAPTRGSQLPVSLFVDTLIDVLDTPVTEPVTQTTHA